MENFERGVQFDNWIEIGWNWERSDWEEGVWSENCDYRSEIGEAMWEGGDGACGWRDPWRCWSRITELRGDVTPSTSIRFVGVCQTGSTDFLWKRICGILLPLVLRREKKRVVRHIADNRTVERIQRASTSPPKTNNGNLIQSVSFLIQFLVRVRVNKN